MRPDDALIPAYGERVPGREYVLRPGAYAVLADAAGRLAMVQTAQGCFLPGGGAEPGESPEEAVRREVWEECGFAIAELHPLGRADEYVHAAEEGRHVCKRGVFFAATMHETPMGHPEDGHEVVWLTLAEAEQRLVHGSQAWAVRAYRQRHPSR